MELVRPYYYYHFSLFRKSVNSVKLYKPTYLTITTRLEGPDLAIKKKQEFPNYPTEWAKV